MTAGRKSSAVLKKEGNLNGEEIERHLGNRIGIAHKNISSSKPKKVSVEVSTPQGKCDS